MSMIRYSERAVRGTPFFDDNEQELETSTQTDSHPGSIPTSDDDASPSPIMISEDGSLTLQTLRYRFDFARGFDPDRPSSTIVTNFGSNTLTIYLQREIIQAIAQNQYVSPVRLGEVEAKSKSKSKAGGSSKGKEKGRGPERNDSFALSPVANTSLPAASRRYSTRSHAAFSRVSPNIDVSQNRLQGARRLGSSTAAPVSRLHFGPGRRTSVADVVSNPSQTDGSAPASTMILQSASRPAEMKQSAERAAHGTRMLSSMQPSGESSLRKRSAPVTATAASSPPSSPSKKGRNSRRSPSPPGRSDHDNSPPHGSSFNHRSESFTSHSAALRRRSRNTSQDFDPSKSSHGFGFSMRDPHEAGRREAMVARQQAYQISQSPMAHPNDDSAAATLSSAVPALNVASIASTDAHDDSVSAAANLSDLVDESVEVERPALAPHGRVPRSTKGAGPVSRSDAASGPPKISSHGPQKFEGYGVDDAVNDPELAQIFQYDKIVAATRAAITAKTRQSSESAKITTSMPGHGRRGKTLQRIDFEVTNQPQLRKWQASLPPPVATMPLPAPRFPDHVRNAPRVDDIMIEAIEVYEISLTVGMHLSNADIRNLRLVCHRFADVFRRLMLRSVVASFGSSQFNLKAGGWKFGSPSTSLLTDHGDEISRFGISFECDMFGLAYAKPKEMQITKKTWYGMVTWPVSTYPKFSDLQDQEEFLLSRPDPLTQVLGCLSSLKELALSLDSGHGWLIGPDISDLQLYDLRYKQGTKIFGQSFPTEDVWAAFGRSEYFKWAQTNSINAAVDYMLKDGDSSETKNCIREFQNLKIREYESFRDVVSQHDYDPDVHTGGVALGQANTAAQVLNGQTRSATQSVKASPAHIVQWPLIFNCYNLAADFGGHDACVSSNVADPTQNPLIPGHLTEAQVQWLMETVWAQRAFLISYTTAIIMQNYLFKGVHTLNLAKISSGLISSLAQEKFWDALPGLRQLKMLVIPDWRSEHKSNDHQYAVNMAQSPLTAATKFTEFLQGYIVKLEKLASLTVGFVGGGEHAIGLFARNQHVLPAPVTIDPKPWVINCPRPPSAALLRFDHIRDLTFENCWFSPDMLLAFMENSRDTSLHTLTLNSVSMTVRHSTTSIINGINIRNGLETVTHNLKCADSDPATWLSETIPGSATWTDTLDKITPGDTFIDRKLATGLLTDDPRKTADDDTPKEEFRGHIQRITLTSCGYVHISGVKTDEFNQNKLVHHPRPFLDAGLAVRRNLMNSFSRPRSREGSDTVLDFATRIDNASQGVMMSTKDVRDDEKKEYFGLGTLTQCVHPIERRVLEQAWGMRFGWGDSMERWAAVEDGCYEGGTGRFGGVVE